MTKINLDDVYIDPFWALKIPANTAMRRKILPFLEWEGQVQVAVLDANDSSIARVVSRAVGREVKLIEADKGSFERALVNTYENMAQAGAQGKTGGGDDVVEMSERMLESALMRQSSDIHIDPEADKTFIRFRTHGQLEEYEILDSSKHVALCSRLKVISSMDISEKRSPQDGQFSFESKSMGRKIDVRVATIATKYGEKMTMRLMAMDVSTFTVEKLGMDREDLGRFEKALQQPHGIILMTGPTGSGKSTSLYAALSHIRKGSSQNIITIEDPVEYDLYGVTQEAVDISETVTFANALRSVLRHDPDIIMIGEIRDKETADIAVKASITGHLVLSSL
ncbi:MAG: Flp pilus assembly complex ATPase component TadA, partial [Lentisphaeraceae bacterium]|nr:Flp pilus assembly complex ATPase component TadA [Lentisphaeraceae bacterium]